MTTALGPAELQPFELSDLDELLDPRSAPCVTLMLTTHRAYPERGQDAIRLRNLIEQARQSLPPAHSGLVDALSELERSARWRACRGGLAVFRSPDTFLVREVPGALPELCEVGKRFVLTPLMAELQRDLAYFVLSLSKNAVRLYSGSSRGLELVHAPAIPVDIRDALGEEQHIRHHDYHAVRRGSAQAMFHGHGGAKDATRYDTERFLRAVDAGLWLTLRDESAPLILAAVEATLAIFQQVCRYPLLLPEGVAGNFEHADPAELHRQTWPLIAKLSEEVQERALQEARAAFALGETLRDKGDILAAAAARRISQLFVSETALPLPSWLEDACQATLRCGGEVTIAPELPGPGACCALVRWSE